MFSNIVLATDGSKHAAKALKIAIDLANKYDAELTLVHVLNHDHPSDELVRMVENEHLDVNPFPKDLTDEIHLSTEQTKRNMLRSEDKEAMVINAIGEQILTTAKREAGLAGVKKIMMELHSGDYANAILKVAEDKNAEIIVMGHRGLSRLKGFMTGSVSHKVSQRANCSVLTIK